MANWVRRVTNLFSQDAPPNKPGPADRAAAPAATADPTLPQAGPLPDLDHGLFDWLLDAHSPADRAPTPAEAAWLAELDPLIAADKGKGDLLPRAAGVIPPLLNSLRDEGQSAAELAQRVEKDPNLVAEVIRLANTFAFRGGEPVTQLADAIRRVGTAGVRQAIAKVVLKPMFDAQADQLSGRASARLWTHSQAQADLCRAVAVERGMDPFEAYLGGLLRNVGWTAGLRALDRVFEQHPGPADLSFGSGFKDGFRERRDRLFAQIVTGWRLSPALHAAARSARHAGGLAASPEPLAAVLVAGERLATLRVLASANRLTPTDADAITHWSAAVRSVYATLE